MTLRRDLQALAGSTYDLLVVGGGVHGAAIAWDAALRGLTVALLERDDFGAATSANSLRIVHGGFRYLQHAQLGRVRRSSVERSAWLRIAPRQVRPFPFLLPLMRWRLKGPLGCRLALRTNELLTRDRNRGLAPPQEIPAGRVIGRDEAARLAPVLADSRAQAAALWYDAQVVSPERLVLTLVQSAASRGAEVANHAEVTSLLESNGWIVGVRVRDRLKGDTFDVRARQVVVAAGPWTPAVASRNGADSGAAYALAFNLVTERRLLHAGLALRSRKGIGDEPVAGGGRFLFAVPWSRGTMFGTSYRLATPGAEHPTQADVARFIGELNHAWPGLDLRAEEVTLVQGGLLPLRAGRQGGRPGALADHARIVSHSGTDGRAGLISVEGTKLTTARSVAEVVVDHVFRCLGYPPPTCRTAWTHLYDSAVPDIDGGSSPDGVPPDGLVTGTLRAVRHEMACTLADVAIRRLGLQESGLLGRMELDLLADIMGAELGWTGTRRDTEIARVEAIRAGLPAS